MNELNKHFKIETAKESLIPEYALPDQEWRSLRPGGRLPSA